MFSELAAALRPFLFQNTDKFLELFYDVVLHLSRTDPNATLSHPFAEPFTASSPHPINPSQTTATVFPLRVQLDQANSSPLNADFSLFSSSSSSHSSKDSVVGVTAEIVDAHVTIITLITL